MSPYPPAPAPRPAAATTTARWRQWARRRGWAWVRVLGGLAILAVLAWRLGAGTFLDGLRMVDGGTLLAATGIGVLTTVLSAGRWCLVARGLGVRLPLAGATADYYRAQFLNAALPGGVLGDVHRAVRHGRELGNLGLGVRAVVLERTAGQVVFVAVAVAVLVAVPNPVLAQLRPGAVPAGVWLVAAGLAGVALLAGFAAARPRRAASRAGRALRAAVASVRHGLLARRLWPGIVLLSAVVPVGYLATFLVAARATGVTAPTVDLVPLLMLALLAMALPVNVGGWGPREGACAWAFGVAGLGAAQGLTVAVVYGVSVFVASLPGAVVLAVRWRRQRGPASPAQPAPVPAPAPVPVPVAVPNRSDSA